MDACNIVSLQIFFQNLKKRERLEVVLIDINNRGIDIRRFFLLFIQRTEQPLFPSASCTGA